MRFVDFLFWQYYCFCERHKRVFFGYNVWQALNDVFLTTACGMGVIWSLVEDKIPLNILNMLHLTHTKVWVLLLIPIGGAYILFYKRYTKKNAITQNNFQIFRERWGDPEHTKRSHRIIMWCYTLVMIMSPVILGMIKRFAK